MRDRSESLIDVVLLGTGGMMPLPHRWLSSLLIRVGGHQILFDCGEGTQIAWREAGWGLPATRDCEARRLTLCQEQKQI